MQESVTIALFGYDETFKEICLSSVRRFVDVEIVVDSSQELNLHLVHFLELNT
jgi:hypothetical protein